MIQVEILNKKEGGIIPAFLSLILGLGMALSSTGCAPADNSLPPVKPADSAEQQAAVLRLEGRTMGTGWHATVISPPADLGLQLRVQDALNEVDNRMSTYKPDSELSRFNRGSEEFTGFSALTLEVLRYSQDLSRRCQGAFDITVMPLIDLWGFGPKPAENEPNAEALNAVMQRIGWQNLHIAADGTVSKGHPAIELDLSAVAKGFGVDRAFLALQEAGIEHFMIEVGGEIRTAGLNAKGLPWRIGIDRPILDRSGQQHQLQDVIAITDYSIATSGDYRNYREKDGHRISHMVDPRTGRPIRHKLASVTILAPTCMQADALATAVSVLGVKAGLALIAELPGVEAYLILRDDQGYSSQETPGFAEYRLAPKGR